WDARFAPRNNRLIDRTALRDSLFAARVITRRLSVFWIWRHSNPRSVRYVSTSDHGLFGRTSRREPTEIGPRTGHRGGTLRGVLLPSTRRAFRVPRCCVRSPRLH